MRLDLTDIVMVIDRSGSMAVGQKESESGINKFIELQKGLPGEALLTLVQFDTKYDFIHQGVNIKNVPHYTLQPRGNTALLDAVGRAINETGERLKNIPEDQRPGLVVFCVITDGQENSSSEFTKQQIKEMIEHQQNMYQWQFTFLGADYDAFSEAGSLGFNLASTANYSKSKSATAYMNLSNNVGRMRAGAACGQSVSSYYTDKEREDME
jgi:uncharacterized protein YegL